MLRFIQEKNPLLMNEMHVWPQTETNEHAHP